MIYDELPIFKAMLDFVVYVETIVKSFDKHHKYTIGEDLRTYAKEMFFLVHKVNMAKENRLIFLSGKNTSSRRHPLLRTVRATFTAYGSSINN